MNHHPSSQARYSRQMILPEVGTQGQELLADARILIIGMGGLGCAAAQYLAAAGIGQMLIADDDRVEISNLHRQVLHDQSSLGAMKTASAQQRLLSLNPDICIETIPHRLGESELISAVASVDYVLDASDNFATRYAINRACIQTDRILVSGAAIRLEGQLTVLRPARSDQACYACLYPQTLSTETDEDSCENSGVLGPLVGVIGAMQAMETLKLILNLGRNLTGRLLHYDAAQAQWREIKIKPDPECNHCLTGRPT